MLSVCVFIFRQAPFEHTSLLAEDEKEKLTELQKKEAFAGTFVQRPPHLFSVPCVCACAGGGGGGQLIQ